MQNNMTPLMNCTRITNVPLSPSFTNEQGLGLTEDITPRCTASPAMTRVVRTPPT